MLHFTYGYIFIRWCTLITHVVVFRFLYTLFIAVDANFKLKSKDRGIKDIELSAGGGCFVETDPYEKHLEEYGAKAPEVCDYHVSFLLRDTDVMLLISQLNTCHSNHDAIARANLSIPGYKVNGTGLVLCSQHALIRSNGVGDLVKGEK